MINCSEVRVGDILRIDGELFRVVDRQHVKPGKGGAFYQFEFKKLAGNQKVSKRIRVEESLDKVDIYNRPGIFLYSQGDIYTFLDLENHQQYDYNGSDIVNVEFLKDNMEVSMFFLNMETLIDIRLPMKVIEEVDMAPGYIKGQSASSQDKTVTLKNGRKIKTPQYVDVGDKIEINLETMSFVRRV